MQVSPSTGVTYQYLRMNGDTLTLDGRLSWHALFPVGGERGSVKAGADTGTWSLRAEYRFAQAFKVAATPIDILLSEQPGGFGGKVIATLILALFRKRRWRQKHRSGSSGLPTEFGLARAG